MECLGICGFVAGRIHSTGPRHDLSANRPRLCTRWDDWSSARSHTQKIPSDLNDRNKWCLTTDFPPVPPSEKGFSPPNESWVSGDVLWLVTFQVHPAGFSTREHMAKPSNLSHGSSSEASSTVKPRRPKINTSNSAFPVSSSAPWDCCVASSLWISSR